MGGNPGGMGHPHPRVPMGEQVLEGHTALPTTSPYVPMLAPSCSRLSSKAPNHHFPPVFFPLLDAFQPKKKGEIQVAKRICVTQDREMMPWDADTLFSPSVKQSREK